MWGSGSGTLLIKLGDFEIGWALPHSGFLKTTSKWGQSQKRSQPQKRGLPQKWRQPQKWRWLLNKENLKNENDLKIEDDLKNKGDLTYEEDLKDEEQTQKKSFTKFYEPQPQLFSPLPSLKILLSQLENGYIFHHQSSELFKFFRMYNHFSLELIYNLTTTQPF